MDFYVFLAFLKMAAILGRKKNKMLSKNDF